MEPPREWRVPRRKVAYVRLDASALVLSPCPKHIIAIAVADDFLRVVKEPGPDTHTYVPTAWLALHDPALFGLPVPVLQAPALSAGTPAIWTVRGAASEWVRVRELATAVPDDAPAFGAFMAACREKSRVARCDWDELTPVKRKVRHVGPTEDFVPLSAVRSAFPMARLADDPDPTPTRAVYSLPDDSRPWVAYSVISEEAGVEDSDLEGTVAAASRLTPKGSIFALVGADLTIAPCPRGNPRGFWFLDAAVAIAHHSEATELVHDLVAPGVPQPALPHYAIAGSTERYVSVRLLRRACASVPELAGVFPDDDIPDAQAVKDVWKQNRSFAFRAHDGTLHAATGQAARASPMVSMTRLATHPTLSTLLPLCGPGAATLPIVLSAGPVRSRAGRAGSDQVYKKALKCTVKCGIRERLADPGARRAILDLVDTVSRMSRYGSLLMNLHVLRLLAEGGGAFAAGSAPDVWDTLVTNAMGFARKTQKPGRKYAELGLTAQRYAGDLDALEVPHVSGIGNTVKAEANQYVTSFLTAVSESGENRIRRLFIAAAELEGVWVRGLDTRLKGHVQDGTALSGDLHPRLAALAASYRELYVSKGLDGSFKFDVNALKGDKAKQSRRVAAILEVHWRINRDLVDIETAAVATGRWQRACGGARLGGVADGLDLADASEDDPDDLEDRAGDPDDAPESQKDVKVWRRRTFALLPVNDLRKRHVRIDRETWTLHLFDTLHGMDVQGLEYEAFMSLFKSGARSRRDDVSLLRSPGTGWTIGRSFTTDGTTIQMTYVNLGRSATSDEKRRSQCKVAAEDAFGPLPEGAVVVGIDPGVINPLAAAWTDGDGVTHTKSLTHKDYYWLGHIDSVAKRRERRVSQRARAEVEALSATRRKTADLGEFAAYAAACNSGADALWDVYGDEKASSERFEIYRHKTKALDGWFSELRREVTRRPDGAPRESVSPVVVLAWGNAKFNASMRGCRAVPTSRVSARVRSARKAEFVVREVDEYLTTQNCVACHHRLQSGRRWKETKRGGGWYTDRDVKWCTSPACLESHPCPAAAELLEGVHADDRRRKARAVDRDLNSALAMARLVGLRNEERPQEYRR
jgi:hypothetical protein